MPRSSLPRRTLLRGLLGGAAVSMGLPLLEVFLNNNGTALASGSPLPRRFGIFYWGNGVLDQLNTLIPPSCDEAAGRFLGLSFAGWNVLASAFWAAVGYRAALGR